MNEKAAICYNVHMETRLSDHSAYRMEYHIIWIPKYRCSTGLRGYLRKLFPKILRSLPGCELIEYSIEIDHIHMIMIIPPKYSVANAVGQIKSQSTINLRKKFPWLSQVYCKENIVWSPGYFVSTVGIDDEDNHQICTISVKPGFRSNDACIVLKVPRACPWVSTERWDASQLFKFKDNTT